jgi:hypothetical protein
MSRELWKVGVQWRDRRPEGNIRHSQVIAGYGPGALVDFVNDAAILAGLSWWAKGPEIVEDRLTAMLARQDGYERVKLFSPPIGNAKDLEDPTRKWIKAFRFPQWFACQNERCWDDSEQPPRRDGARPRRLLHIGQLDGTGHKCKGGKGKAEKVQPIRFTRACRFGHIDDIEWFTLVHRKNECKRPIMWVDEAGANGDLQDVRITCSGCGANLRMSVAAQQFTDDGPTLGLCAGKRPWLGDDKGEGCAAPMRFLLRSASHAYFSVAASVIHIPDPAASLREQVSKAIELIKNAKSAAQIEMLRELQDPVKAALEGISNDAAFAEVMRRREGKPVAYKKVKEAEIELLQNLPPALSTDRPGGRFFGRTIALPKKRSKVMEPVDRVVLIHRLSEVRALVGFTRFEPKTADVDGELDIGVEVAKLDQPLTWLPAVENYGEGFFLLAEGGRAREMGGPGSGASSRGALREGVQALAAAARGPEEGEARLHPAAFRAASLPLAPAHHRGVAGLRLLRELDPGAHLLGRRRQRHLALHRVVGRGGLARRPRRGRQAARAVPGAGARSRAPLLERSGVLGARPRPRDRRVGPASRGGVLPWLPADLGAVVRAHEPVPRSDAGRAHHRERGRRLLQGRVTQ